jgi:ABC-2 type transport system ATP-binding protein
MDSAVEVKQLVKVYSGKTRALDGVDLSVGTGEVFALLGPNGAGKTTLMRILTTQLEPTSGNALVFGMDTKKDSSGVRKAIGYVPQEMSVWTDVTGYENLLIYSKIYGIPADKRKEAIDEALHTMGLSEVKDRLVSTYSGGMIRRLEIACIMMIKPRILFLDEPTIGLDPSARKAVWERLSGFKKEYNGTIFFNTHYMDEADQYSDSIAIINSGKIVMKGTAQELKDSVGGEVITLSVSIMPDEKTMASLKSIKDIIDVISQKGPASQELKVIVKHAETSLPRVLKALDTVEIAVDSISMTKPTLDDVFLKYAGTKMEAAGSGVSEVRQMRRMIKAG